VTATPIEHVRAIFASFEQSIETPDAASKLREALDAAMDIIEGDHDERTTQVARNLVQAYRRRLSEKITVFLSRGGVSDVLECDHFYDLADLFAMDSGLGDDQSLKYQRTELFVRLFLDLLRRASLEEKEQLMKWLKQDSEP
jgi:hypothetical protein